MATPGKEFKEEVGSQVVSKGEEENIADIEEDIEEIEFTEGGIEAPPPDFDPTEPIFANKPTTQAPVTMASMPSESLLGASRLTNP
eukprot:1567111-Ditylum_brightwellii.AAC.1